MFMQYPKGQRALARGIKQSIGLRFFAQAKALKMIFPLHQVSYSQNNEDLAISKYFLNETGRYLDIGAGNPVYLSNTYYFYKRGWSGFFVEPQGENSRIAKILRRRDTVIKKVVSQISGKITFFTMEPSFYSTIDPKAVQKWKQEEERLW